MIPGRDDKAKKEIAVKEQQFLAIELNIDEKFISVSIENVEKKIRIPIWRIERKNTYFSGDVKRICYAVHKIRKFRSKCISYLYGLHGIWRRTERSA